MIRACCVCKKEFGEKEPLEDKSVSHGICPTCYPEEMKKIEEGWKTRERHNLHEKVGNQARSGTVL